MKKTLISIVLLFLGLQLTAQEDPASIELPKEIDRILREYETH
jgi:hypothetical protein